MQDDGVPSSLNLGGHTSCRALSVRGRGPPLRSCNVCYYAFS